MASTNPNPGSQPITKIYEKVERFTTKSGKVVEIKLTEVVTFDGTNFIKKEILEWPEGFEDSRKIDDLSETRNCCVCDRLYHKETNKDEPCRFCGEYYCQKCVDEVVDKDTGEKLPACKLCADKKNAGIIKRAYRKLYNLDA